MSFYFRWMLKKLGVVPTHAVTIRKGLKVLTPDGIELATDLYLGSPNAAAPAILIRSPYGISAMLAAAGAYPLASQGFNVVMQSCRGTFASTGKFDPHHDEQRDGLTAIDWIKQQSWCNGSIATFGMSYLGYTQWAVAAAAGPEVKAMAMQVTLSDFAQMTYSGDSFSLKNALTWTQMVTWMKSPSGMLRVMLAQILRRPSINAKQWRELPLSGMDEKIIGERVGFWRDWVQHDSANDPWWAPMSHRKTIGSIKRPISMVAGWHDIFLPYQLHDFVALQKNGCDTRITIGPWRHTDMGLGQTGVKDAIEWFNRHLRGQAPAQQKTVRLYVVNADEWREFDAWPPRESRIEQWHLQPQKKLLDRPAPDSQADQYRYDPADPTPSIGGPALEAVPYSLDNAALEARTDVMTYTSEPLAQSRDIVGPVIAELFVSSSAKSADFFVRLCAVDAKGVSMNICDGIQRVRIESSGAPQKVRIELWPTAYRIVQGRRIRVQISSGAFPRWARNLGGGEPLETATELHAATQSIHHSPNCPSVVLLPFI